jgi:hypothetical protein
MYEAPQNVEYALNWIGIHTRCKSNRLRVSQLGKVNNKALYLFPRELAAFNSKVTSNLVGLDAAEKLELAAFPHVKTVCMEYPSCVDCVDFTGMAACSNLTELGLRLTGALDIQVGLLQGLLKLSVCLVGQAQSHIPTELGKLTAATHLSLEGNIGGTIPSELGQMRSLTHLAIVKTNVESSIPCELGCLSELRHLHLNENKKLSGFLPQELYVNKCLKCIHLPHGVHTAGSMYYGDWNGNVWKRF